MGKPLSLLLIEDSEDDALLVLRELRRGGYDVSYTRVETAEALLAALEQQSWDVILSDYSMPMFSAPEALRVLQQSGIDTPFIIVSGTVGEDTAVAAMKAGANDFFAKDKLIRLVPAVERELRDARERRIREHAEQQLNLSEDRFAKVFNASPIGICISRMIDGMVVDVNARYCELFGFERNEVLGRTSQELGVWADWDQRNRVVSELDALHSLPNAEVRFRTKSGDIRHCLVSLELITLDVEPCVLSMIVDITDRKLVEQALERNTALITLLQEVSVAANEAVSVENALRFAVKRVCDFTGWELGHVFLLTRSEQPQLISSVWHKGSKDDFTPFQAASNQMRFDRYEHGLVYRVYATERATWTDDLLATLHPIRAERAAEVGFVAAYAFPVFTNHDVSAVMEFFSTRRIEPDQALLDTIAQVANQVGRVIERTQASSEFSALYNATSYLFNADSLNDLAQQIVNGIVTEFAQVDCGLLLLDRNQDVLVRSARAGEYKLSPDTPLKRDGQGLVPKAIREATVIYAPDVRLESSYIASVPATRSELIVPLKTRKSILGVLDLQSTDIDHFNQSDRRVLSAFAERAAAAIEIMQLVEEINRHAANLELRVTERTEELRRAKQRAEAILNSSSDAIIMTDANGSIRQTNPRFDSQFGYAVDELFGRALTEVFTRESAGDLTQALADVNSARQYRRLELLACRKDGSTLPVDVALSGFSDDENKGIVCSLRDISEQKKLERELREAFEKQKELTEMKTRFVSMVSHEYRTPLAGILTSSSLLKDYHERMSVQRRIEHLETIQTQVQRLTELLDEVLQINKAESVQLEFRRETVQLVSFCQGVIENIRQISPARRVDFAVSGVPVDVEVDTKLFRQIIGNLLSNALKYSPEDRAIWVSLAFETGQVVLKVRDEGIGIPLEDQAQLFSLYHRARNVGEIQGTGLGLAIIKQAVDAHHGTIAVESAPGAGTTFTIALPT